MGQLFVVSLYCRGVRKFMISGMVWKDQPKKVIVLYAKIMNLLLIAPK